jgi:HEPN domain-containing protein
MQNAGIAALGLNWRYLAFEVHRDDLRPAKGVHALVEKELSYHLCRSKPAEILEKVLKAELIRLGWFLKKTHDLEKLAGHLHQYKSDVVPSKPLCAALAEVYFANRYPGFALDPDWIDLRQKLASITGILTTIKSRIGTASGSS